MKIKKLHKKGLDTRAINIFIVSILLITLFFSYFIFYGAQTKEFQAKIVGDIKSLNDNTLLLSILRFSEHKNGVNVADMISVGDYAGAKIIVDSLFSKYYKNREYVLSVDDGLGNIKITKSVDRIDNSVTQNIIIPKKDKSTLSIILTLEEDISTKIVGKT